MTSSFGTNILGQRTDAPPDISELDYKTDTGGDLVDVANKQIEANDRDLAEQSRFLIEQYNDAYEGRDNKIKNFLDSLKSADKLIEKAKPIADYIKTEAEMTSYLRNLEKGVSDDDVKAYEAYEQGINEVRAEGKAGQAEAEQHGESEASRQFGTLGGLTTIIAKRKENARSAMSLFYPQFRAVAEATEFKMPNGARISYNDAFGADKAYLDNKIDGIFVNHMNDLGYGWGFMKKYVLNPLQRIKSKREIDRGIAAGRAIKADITNAEREEFLQDIKDDPNAIIDWMKIQYPYMGFEWKATRNKIFGWLEYGVENDPDIDLKVVRAVLNHQFQGNDFNLKKVKEYWGPEAGRLITKVNKKLTERRLEEKREHNGRLSEFKLRYYESWQKAGSVTKAMVTNAITEFRKEFPGVTVPQWLQTADVNTNVDDEFWISKLEHAEQKGWPITEATVAMIQDHTKRQLWIPKIGTGMTQEDQDERDKFFILPLINETLQENFEKTGIRSRKFKANEYHMRELYNKTYLRIMKMTKDKNAAHSEARKEVENQYIKLGKGETSWAVMPNDPVKLTLYNAVLNGATIIGKDGSGKDTFLNNPTPHAGEKAYLEQGLQHIKGLVQMPVYFQALTGKDGIQMHPLELLKKRLIATGMAKEEDFPDLPERFLNKPSNQKALLVNTSEGNTYRVFNDKEENTALLLDAVSHNPADGYNSVYHNGEAVQPTADSETGYTKPLEQMTVGEVWELAQKGYTNFGMYGIPAHILQETLLANSSSITLEDTFDQKTQDALVLARLRYRLAEKNKLTGLEHDYLRLVNISPDLEKQFNTLLGGIPENNPYMQLRNMLPEVAEALVSDNTQ